MFRTECRRDASTFQFALADVDDIENCGLQYNHNRLQKHFRTKRNVKKQDRTLLTILLRVEWLISLLCHTRQQTETISLEYGTYLFEIRQNIN